MSQILHGGCLKIQLACAAAHTENYMKNPDFFTNSHLSVPSSTFSILGVPSQHSYMQREWGRGGAWWGE